ncbi:hypothetical protein BaRGS_00008922, partial [Batillaria attramentaria]
KCANGNWCCLAKDPRVTSFIEDILIRIRGGYRVLQKTCDRCPVAIVAGVDAKNCITSCTHSGLWVERLELVDHVLCDVWYWHHEQECCVDGNWGPWQPWSRVSVTCGVGQRDRRRRCDNPAANYCGRTCPGRDIETESYDTRVPCRICVRVSDTSELTINLGTPDYKFGHLIDASGAFQ